MKLFITSQIRELDKYTIDNEPITSIALMERASDKILQQFKKDFSLQHDVLVLCGPGNNGGDGLALGRMLLQIGYDVQVVLFREGKLSAECQQNKERLLENFPDFFTEQIQKFAPIEVSDKTIIVDALLGSGLTRPLEGIFADGVNWINSLHNKVVSIDIPSGLDGEKCAIHNQIIVKATVTYTLQFPKLAFFFSENEKYVGKWKVIDIQIHSKGIEAQESKWNWVEKPDIVSTIKKRSQFCHKGNFGHIFLFAGSKGMAGAAVLSATSALRAGAGLVTVFGVEENREILQTSIPEAMYISNFNDLQRFTTFAFGPGMGTAKDTEQILFEILKNVPHPCVIDADALNIISQNPDFWEIIPKKSIITPHPKEFERLFGKGENTFVKIQLALQKAKEYEIIIILKGAYTSVCTSTGEIYINSTGNPGMATGGMGDVLTGIIAGLLSQNYSALDSAILGVYLHGLAADLALENQSEESLLPRDVIEKIGRSYRFIQ